MVKIFGIQRNGGITGFMLIDEDGTKYASMHTFKDQLNGLAVIARTVEPEQVKERFHPELTMTQEPHPIPAHIRGLFQQTYGEIGYMPLIVTNENYEYIIN